MTLFIVIHIHQLFPPTFFELVMIFTVRPDIYLYASGFVTVVGEVWFRVAGYVLVCEKAGSWPGCSVLSQINLNPQKKQ